ncbi:hypothetical protein [Marinactinospora rubrisoli]|uniref:Uncharacterized protein n=1 Tax=Marinactinospora rubrisoli TaxID=2715399 RepID=A0ABW2KKB4_9ACTN
MSADEVTTDKDFSKLDHPSGFPPVVFTATGEPQTDPSRTSVIDLGALAYRDAAEHNTAHTAGRTAPATPASGWQAKPTKRGPRA